MNLAALPFVKRQTRIAAFLTSADIQWQWLVNIALLIVGLGVGQGAIFLVQTMLVATGEYALLAAFGLHYSFAILAILLVDAGGTTILARMVARLSPEQRPSDSVWLAFCEMSTIRLLIAVLIGAAAAVYALGLTSDRFSQWYVALALPGLLLWSVNPVGLLDGQRMSGISGITGSAAYLITAVGLASAAHRPPEVAGAVLGGAFSIGYVVTLAAQWVALRRMGWRPRFRRPTRSGLLTSLKDGCALLFQLVPGQINMRVQLVLSTAYLGTETTALFIYAKQVVTAFTQIIGFVLRVEFPGLVEKLATSRKQSIASILSAQRTTLYLAIAFSTGTTVVSGVAALTPGFSLHEAAKVMVLFAPTIGTLSLSLMMTQALAAMGVYAVIARALVFSSAMGIAACYLLISKFQIYALALGELTFHFVGFYLVFRYLRQTV